MPEAEHIGIDAGRRALARGDWAAATLDRGAGQYATQRYAMRRNLAGFDLPEQLREVRLRLAHTDSTHERA
jgi:hypothetical protein